MSIKNIKWKGKTPQYSYSMITIKDGLLIDKKIEENLENQSFCWCETSMKFSFFISILLL